MTIVNKFIQGFIIGSLFAVILINWNIRPEENRFLKDNPASPAYQLSNLLSVPEVDVLIAPLTWPISLVEINRISNGWSSDCENTGFPVSMAEINSMRLSIILLLGLYVGSLFLLITKKGGKDIAIILTSASVMSIFVVTTNLNFIFLYLILHLISLSSVAGYFRIIKHKKSWQMMGLGLIILATLIDYILVFMIFAGYQC
ncbi:hypothetical protein IT413_02735 [Candidatus Peregrinibacteria bacterium]|nr:hypothetical protein [Candidatus Peregrinibacteria bacterium]